MRFFIAIPLMAVALSRLARVRHEEVIITIRICVFTLFEIVETEIITLEKTFRSGVTTPFLFCIFMQ